jgi:nucleoside-diphosphate-sugar epimerase
MIQHVLMGYGYCASFLAKELLDAGLECLAIARSPNPRPLKGLSHVCCDLKTEMPPIQHPYVLYYFIPPSETDKDSLLAKCLGKLKQKPLKIIYLGSSGIYGEHHGQWVNESSTCLIKTPRQQARAHAEQQLNEFCQKNSIACARLRIAGIYGPDRIPIDAAQKQTPIITTSQAPYINHIYVKDLAKILLHLGHHLTYHGPLNIADGHPTPMGQMQQMLAKRLDIALAPELDFDSIWQQASAMKKEFMMQNKKLSIGQLQQLLRGSSINLTTIDSALDELMVKP